MAKMKTLDANEAAASVAHRLSEVIAIYPITPSSPMGELSDEWSSAGRTNLWGAVPQVIEMQSEAGAAGAVHGALQAGALSTTFTASQGLLLMIPNMYKIAGELTPFAMHVTARALATHALSIFGDHSDVMACRQTGFAMLCSNNVQEAGDFAAISHAATLRARVPFMHFFDGFRTSHEVSKSAPISDDELRQLISQQLIDEHRTRALTPDKPVIRGTAHNPDTYFQGREAANLFYDGCPDIVRDTMNRFAQVTGRQYHLFDYVGHPKATKVVVVMGSGAETVEETVKWLVERGEAVGVVKVRLYRPFAVDAFIRALPETTRSIAILDRTKEPGSPGEPLYLDVVSALHRARALGFDHFKTMPIVVAGRYGLGSKEFTPAMAKAVFDNLADGNPRREFTVGITDDITHLSLKVDENFDIETPDVFRAVFFGLGADGTVGANKNSIKIIGEETSNFAQGYFVYDSKKSGAITISHLRFGPKPIHAPYLIKSAQFVASHQFGFLDKYDVVGYAAPGAVLLVNSPFPPERVFENMAVEVQQQVIDKRLKVYTIDAYDVAKKLGLGSRVNTIMQTCFFAISGVLPRDQAIAKIKEAIEKTYGRKGAEVVKRNFAAVDGTLEHLVEVPIPAAVVGQRHVPPVVPIEAPDFVQRVTAVMLASKGDLLPVSAFPVDGTWPTATTQWERRAIAIDIPTWDSSLCIQCNKCAMACPHAAIRPKLYDPSNLNAAPETFKSVDYKSPDMKGLKYTLQVAPDDCTGCTLCVMVCPAKDKTNPRHKAIDMTPVAPLRDAERKNYDYFLKLPNPDRTKIKLDVKGSQFLQPLFEYSGACSGCGETPYVKLMTQLFGDRAIIANATGCSSIYSGNLPSTPYCTNSDGRGPAWANSLFEDNAEFGLGMRLAVDQHMLYATILLKSLATGVGQNIVDEIVANADQRDEAAVAAQRERVRILKQKLAPLADPKAKVLAHIADYLVRKSVWILGGDGWAYDIGYGGLDHVIACGRDVNILVMDTEVYSNTGGQASKATPLGAVAKFASSGKTSGKKDLGLMAMAYGNVYVASIAFGAKDVHTVRALQEAESYRGPSLIIAYSHCIAHGYDLAMGLEQQKLAIDTGYWPLYRFDPRLTAEGKNAFQLDYNQPKTPLATYLRNETRFRMVENQDPERFKKIVIEAQAAINTRYQRYERLAKAAIAPAELATH